MVDRRPGSYPPTTVRTQSFITAPIITYGVVSIVCSGAVFRPDRLTRRPSTLLVTYRQSVSLSAQTRLEQPYHSHNFGRRVSSNRDTTAQPSSVTNAGIAAEMDWYGNGPDDGHNRQIQSLVLGQNNLSGAGMEISTILGVYLAAGHTGHAYTVFGVSIPFSTSVLDTTNAIQMTGAAAIRLAAGHQIAFEPTVTYRLAYDSTTGVLRWYQGAVSFVVGKGLSVGFQTVCTANTVLPNYLAGNIVFLAGIRTLRNHTSKRGLSRSGHRLHVLGHKHPYSVNYS